MSSSDLSQVLRPLNTEEKTPFSFPFTLHIGPRTDLWRKPPSTIVANAPAYYVPITLKDFESATMKIKKIPAVYQYDHAHMVFMWEKRPELWIKAGVELYNEDLIRSVVAPGIGGWSDWSVAPPIDNTDIVVLAEREKGGGPALHITINGQLVRGIMGVFAPENLAEVVWVGFGGARNEDVEETMDVEFEAFEVKLKGHSNVKL